MRSEYKAMVLSCIDPRFQDLLKDFPEAEKIAEDNKNYFQKAVDDGYGENFISELIDKK